MSRLDELIQQYCPNGVKKVTLESISSVSIGEFIHKNFQSKNDLYPVFNGGTSNTGYYSKYNRTANKIIISARGANAGFVNRVFTYFWSGNSCYTIAVNNEIADWNYVFYFLKENEASLNNSQQKAGIPAVSKKQVEQFFISLPPLEVQEEIVRILDQFTELNDILNSELLARQKQYEYYRNSLLNFEDLDNHLLKVMLQQYCPDGVKYKYIDECCAVEDNKRKPIKASERTQGKTPYYGANNIQGYVKGFTHDGEYILVAEDGSTSLMNYSIQYVKGKFWANNHVHVVKGGKNLLTRFLYYYLTRFNFLPYLVGGTRAKLNKAQMLMISIPIPPIKVQEEIVRILDQFTELNETLNSELFARQNQNEYYRDKLLTFKELEI